MQPSHGQRQEIRIQTGPYTSEIGVASQILDLPEGLPDVMDATVVFYKHPSMHFRIHCRIFAGKLDQLANPPNAVIAYAEIICHVRICMKAVLLPFTLLHVPHPVPDCCASGLVDMDEHHKGARREGCRCTNSIGILSCWAMSLVRREAVPFTQLLVSFAVPLQAKPSGACCDLLQRAETRSTCHQQRCQSTLTSHCRLSPPPQGASQNSLTIGYPCTPCNGAQPAFTNLWPSN
mmetsp:Transcript_17151/g.47867  ORF Transcript_17151/g.47867 Transcript_17151/m.47867 type:complete len:234 (-) Transcript_17151:167-868(-)